MHTRFISFLLICLPAFSDAQFAISGKVMNHEGNPVPATAITLKATNNSKQWNAIADSLGYFVFHKIEKGTYSLNASAVGYAPPMLPVFISRDTIIQIVLQPATPLLDSVTVTGTKATVERRADRIIYNVSNSITAAGTDVLQAISQVPGVQVSNNEISVVAKGSSRVMINNRLLQLEGEDLLRYLKSFSANQVTRIEVITNPSARYEADGNAGLINIVTKRSNLKGYSGNVQLSSKYYAPGQSKLYGYNIFGELNGSANINYNSGKWSFYGSFNITRNRFLEGFQFDIYYPTQHWMQSDTGLYVQKSFSLIAGADYKLNASTTIGVSYSGGHLIYDGGDYVRNPFYNAAGSLDSLLTTRATYYPLAQPAAFNIHTDIKLDTLGRQLLLNADYFNYYRNDVSDFESRSFDGLGNYKPGGTTAYFDRNKQNIGIYTFKADIDWPTSFANYSFGGKLSFINEYSNAFYYLKDGNGGLTYDENLSNEFDYKENTQALYANVSKTIGKWKTEAGVRGELTQTKGYSYTIKNTAVNNYFRVFPTVMASYMLNEDNNFTFTLGRRINRPSFWNLNPFKSLYTAYSYGEGNPYLQPSYNTNTELSHSYKKLLRTSLFVNRTRDGFMNITFPSADTNLVYTRPENFIRTLRIGIAENISFQALHWWETSFTGTLYHTAAKSSLPAIKNASGMGAYISSFNTIHFNRQKTISGAINYWYQFPEIVHIGKASSYYKLDIGIKASHKQWDFAFNVNDLFRSSAMTYTYNVNGIDQRFTNFQVLRYLQLSINYKFGNSSGRTSSRSSGNDEERGRVP